MAAGRRLFGARGYADVGTPELAREAGVTRGALYHQFADKKSLFAAVVEAVEADLTDQIATRVAESGVTQPLTALRAGADAWLDAAADPVVQRILLLDAPVVLGPEAWREIALRYGLGLTEGLLQAGMDSGDLAVQPLRPLAQILIGALDEAALLIAHADDPSQARRDVETVVTTLLDGLRA